MAGNDGLNGAESMAENFARDDRGQGAISGRRWKTGRRQRLHQRGTCLSVTGMKKIKGQGFTGCCWATLRAWAE